MTEFQTCCKPGCDQPRMISPTTGKSLTMCEAHQRAYWVAAKSTSNAKKDKRPVGRPPAAVAKALQYLADHPETASMGSNRFSRIAHVSNTAALAALRQWRAEHPAPIPANIRPMQRKPLSTAQNSESKSVVPPPSNNAKRVKMLLIDERNGEVWQVTAVREHRIKPLRHPETIEVMKADGYAVLYVQSEDTNE